MNVLLSVLCFASGIIAGAVVWALLIEARPLREEERDEWFGEGR
jgi:hypothetical protein